MEFGDFRNIKNKKTAFFASLNNINGAKDGVYNPSLHNNKIDDLALWNTYSDETKTLFSELESERSKQGLIGNIWDGFKNLTNIGAGSNKAELAIKQAQRGEISTDKAREKLLQYKDGQKTCLDVAADIFSSVFAIGIFAATVPTGAVGLAFGLGLSTLGAGGIKLGIKGIDSKLNNREYNSKNAAYDLVTGALNGLFAPVTNGLGSSLTKTIGCKLGLEIGGDIIGAGAKTTLKNLIINQSIDVAGGNAAKRALALGAGMALDGALGASVDNSARAALEGKSAKDVAKSGLSGFFSGLIFSPVIGGSFRLAGKLGQSAGKKIFKKGSALNVKKANKNAPVFSGKKKDITFGAGQGAEIKAADTLQADKPLAGAYLDNVIENLKKSLNNIPEGKEKRIAFLQDFFQTNLKTGEKAQYDKLSPEFASIEVEAWRLAKYNDDTIKSALKHSLKMSQLNDTDMPYSYLTEYMDFCPDIYKKIEQRNIYEIFEKRKALFGGSEKTSIEDIITLGEMPEHEYQSVNDLIQAAGFLDKRVKISNLISFSRNVDANLVDYMRKNGLFNLDNIPAVKSGFELYFVFNRLDRATVEKMYKRGLLAQIPERGGTLNINDAIFLVNELDDMQWQNAVKRNLLSLKSADGKYLNVSNICLFAQMDDEAFLNVLKRDLLNKTGTRTVNAGILAQLSDDEWQKFTDRGLDASRPNLSNPRNLINLLSISDSDWEIAKARGLKFTDNDDFKLLELSGEQWQNITRRNLHNSDVNYNTDSKILISQLSDGEYEAAKKRGLINDVKSPLNKEFSREDLFLAKCSDEQYALYFKRGLDKKDYDAEIKERLLKMDDKHFIRTNEEIIPLLYPPQSRNFWSAPTTKDLNECCNLAELDDEAYETVLEFIHSGSRTNRNFTTGELKNIAGMTPEQKQRLRTVLEPTENSSWNKVQKSSLLKLVKLNAKEFEAVQNALDYFTIEQIERYTKEGTIAKIAAGEAFAENKALLAKINGSGLDLETKNVLTDILLKTNDYDFSSLNLRQKTQYIKLLEEVQKSNVLSAEEKSALALNSVVENCRKTLSNVITPVKVSREDVIRMMKGFFANNDKKLEQLLSTAQFEKFRREGLPLAYSRKSFLGDLNSVLKGVPQNEQAEIFKKMGIKPIFDAQNIIGYNGIINLEGLSNEGIEGKVSKLAVKFIKENSVTTGEKELDEALNSLICAMPEFINTIGKQQHSAHDFSLDIHILTVLKDAIANPEYQKLSNEEKFCLKIAAILHDIAKSEGVKDSSHPDLSALYARDILSKDSMVLPDEMKNRIYELIKNHHWLAAYNTNKVSADELAVIFRRSGDLKIAQIMAQADLMGINANLALYHRYANALSDSMQKPIELELNRINATGQMFLPNRIVTPSKIPTVEYEGKTYRVINFKELDKNTDLFRYGFEPGTNVDNIRFFIHTVDDNKISNLENVYRLNDSNNGGFICVSYASVQDNPTFGNNKFGLSLYGENVNIANASFINQGSGSNKDFMCFSETLRGQNYKSAHRKLIPDAIKKELGLSDEEYSQLYAKMQKYRYPSQLDNDREIKLGEKVFSARQIKNAIRNADEVMIISLRSQHNEANLYSPKTQGIIAKTDSIEQLPKELLDFAQKHNLPIFLLGA